MKSTPTRSRWSRPALASAAAFAAMHAAGPFAQAQTITNPSFEENAFAVFPGYISGNTAINGWTGVPTAKVGLNPAAGSPFANNGAIPDGTNVAFLQNSTAGDTFLSTDITGLTPGQKYKVTFRINARSAQLPRLKVWTHAAGDAARTPTSTPVAMVVQNVTASNPYRYAAYDFVATAETQTLALNNFITTGDHTVVVDNFTVVPSTGGWSYSAWTGDADSGIDPSYLYTHAYTFGGSAVTTNVNGVPFIARTGGNPQITGRLLVSGLGNAFGDVTRNITGNSNAVGKSFIYGGPVMGLKVSNLKPNTAYVATIYGVAFDAQPVARASTFSSSLNPADRLTVDLDQYNQTKGIKVEYRYTTDALGSPVDISYTQTGDGSFHTSAFSNREAVASVPATQWHYAAWNDDATSGVDPTYTYTHAYNFGSTASPNINGVSFTGAGGANPASATFSTNNLSGVFNNDPNNTTGFGSRALANDFVYNGFPAQLNLTGLTPGKQYVLTVYSEGWEAPGARFAQWRGDASDPGSIIDQDVFDNNNGIRIEHTYTAPASGNYAITSLPTAGNSTHYYGFSNREAEPMVNVAPVITLSPSNVNTERNASVGFRAAATGSGPLSYQWQFNGADIPGETGVALSISSVTAANQGNYRCVVSNGSGSAFTAEAVLTVYDVVPGLFDTGMGSNAAVLGDNAGDPHYLLLVNPDGDSLISAVVEDSLTFPIVTGPWLANTATSKWIGPRFNTAASAGELVDAGAGAGVYVYRTTFDLTGFDPASVTITGNWAMDNIGTAIKVNDGHPNVANPVTGITNSGGFAGYATFTLNSSNSTFVPGLNTIDFYILNQTVAVGYTGLRISGLKGLGRIPAGTAPHIAVEPVDTVVTRNVASALTVQASGSADLSYQWFKIVAPGVNYPIPGATSPVLAGGFSTPAQAADLNGQFFCEVSNGSGKATSAVATVTAYNGSPVANDDGYAATKDAATAIPAAALTGNDSDPDGDALTITAVSAASAQGGTVALSGSGVVYTPPAGFSGTDSFTYSIADGWGGTATATVTVAIYATALPAFEEMIFTGSGGTREFCFRGVSGRAYRLQRTEDLVNWTDIEVLSAPADGIVKFQDLTPPAGRGMYRIAW